MPGWIGWCFLVFMLVLVPLLVLRTVRRFNERPIPPRMAVMRNTLAQQVFFGAFAWYTAKLEGLWIFPIAMPTGWGVAAATAFVGLAVLAMRPIWGRAVQQRERRTLLLMPQGPRESAMWLAVSAAAGVSEELVWRGVLWGLLTRVLGDPIAAAAICVVMFTLAHAVQGWRSMLAISLFSALFHVLAWASGTLAVAMLAHAAYDMIAGFRYARLARASGWGA